MSGVYISTETFAAALRLQVADLEKRGGRAMFRVANKVRNEAVRACPVDTGRLRSSIQISEGSNGRGPVYQVGTNVHYASYVEYGTRRMGAQPFMRPAMLKAAQWWEAEGL